MQMNRILVLFVMSGMVWLGMCWGDIKLNSAASKARGVERTKSLIPEYDAEIAANPQGTNAYADRAFSRMVLEDYAGALLDMERHVRLHPDKYSSYMGRAMAKKSVCDYKGAVSDYTTARMIFDGGVSAMFLRERAECYWLSGDYGAAIRDKAADLSWYLKRM